MTTENNILLAEFMGAEIEGLNYKFIAYDNIKVCMHPNRLNYHTDWNWLMQVVEKIEDLGNDVSITTNYIQIAFDEGEQFIVAEDTKIKIDTLYNACVEFVKWYNSSKEA